MVRLSDSHSDDGGFDSPQGHQPISPLKDQRNRSERLLCGFESRWRGLCGVEQR